MTEKERITMKALPETERPYELFEKHGGEGMTDAQLLAILLRSGTQTETSLELSMRCLSKFKGIGLSPLNAFFSLSQNELMEIKGIGRVKAIQVQTVAELCRRLSRYDAQEQLDFHEPESVANCYMETMRNLKRECARVAFVSSRMKFLGDHLLGYGTLDRSLIDERVIFQKAIEKGAYGFVLLHNHPSGNPEPSGTDFELTRSLKEAGDVMKIYLLDHIIIGDQSFYSFSKSAPEVIGGTK